MKNLLHLALPILIVTFVSCKKDISLAPTNIDLTRHDTTVYVYPDGYNALNAIAQPINLGVPVYLQAQNDVISNSLKAMVNLSLQNFVSVPKAHPEYLSSNAINVINVTAKSNIYITFVAEDTGYKSTLAYYTYKTGNPPTAASGGSIKGAMDKVIYIFPNTISQKPNGGMVAGNKVNLGTFDAGTSIGFVLIVNAWTGSDIKTTQTKYYSEDNLNPETVGSLKRHAVMLYDDTDQLYLISFEDLNRQNPACDNDFYDVTFYVSANVSNSISNTNVVTIAKPSN